MTGIYLNDWADGGMPAMLSDFGIDESALNGAGVLLASYTYEHYSGDAIVILKQGDQLFEVNGGHCSCYGLEDQWHMEPVTKEALMHRLQKGSYGEEDKIKGHLIAALASLTPTQKGE